MGNFTIHVDDPWKHIDAVYGRAKAIVWVEEGGKAIVDGEVFLIRRESGWEVDFVSSSLCRSSVVLDEVRSAVMDKAMASWFTDDQYCAEVGMLQTLIDEVENEEE